MAFAQNMQAYLIDRYGEGDWAQIEPYLDSNFDIYYPLGLKKK